MTKRLFAMLDVYYDRMPRSAVMNMAIDEALLEHAISPSIRFYHWDHPALSFGYFGKFADVAEHRMKRDLVRRWTGGGIVLHGDDLTYSVIIPASAGVFATSSRSIYAAIHSALRDALNIDGQRAELAPAVEGAVTDSENSSQAGYEDNSLYCSHAPVARPTAHSPASDGGPQGRGYGRQLCFANPVRADVMVNGQKVAGAAQRRTRGGLLHEGSIQYVDVGNGLAERFVQALSADRSERKIADEVLDLAWEIALQKYGTDAWLRRR